MNKKLQDQHERLHFAYFNFPKKLHDLNNQNFFRLQLKTRIDGCCSREGSDHFFKKKIQVCVFILYFRVMIELYERVEI